MFASSTATETDWYAVLADAAPDGHPRPVAVGRLRSTYPNLVVERTLFDKDGTVVRPYNDRSAKTVGAPGEVREYHIELWPVGNVFDVGHRVRLYVLGPGAAATLPAAEPAVNTVLHDAARPSSLTLPMADDAKRTRYTDAWSQ